MIYLLDTNAVVAILRDRPDSTRHRLRQAFDDGEEVAVSSVALFELWYGVARSERQQENADRLRTFLSGEIAIVAFEDQDAIIGGRLRRTLELVGMPIVPYDLLIAAHAIRLEATLVTANVSEFARIDGLLWEDWGG